MGTLTTLHRHATSVSGTTDTESGLRNAARGFLRALEAACQNRILNQDRPSRKLQERELADAIFAEAEQELAQIRADLQQVLRIKPESE